MTTSLPGNDELARLVEEHQRDLAVRWTRIQGGVVHETPELTRFIAGFPVSFTNGVHAARIAPGNLDALVAETVDAFRSAGVPALWWIGPNTVPADLGSALERVGFRHEEDMPWLAVPTRQVTAGEVTSRQASRDVRDDLEIERVLTSGSQRAWEEVMLRGFGMTEAERGAMTSLADVVGYGADAGWVRFVGRMDGRAVATSGVMFGGGVAGLYNVTTVPEARRRGFGSAMTRAALAYAAERGAAVAVLGSSAMALPMYRRMGFEDACQFSVYLWGPDGNVARPHEPLSIPNRGAPSA